MAGASFPESQRGPPSAPYLTGAPLLWAGFNITVTVLSV